MFLSLSNSLNVKPTQKYDRKNYESFKDKHKNYK